MAPLAEYLTTQTGAAVRFKAAPNLGAAVSDLVSGETSLAYLTPAAYIDARDKAGVVPLASPLTKGAKTFSLVIGVRTDSPLKNCPDLNGRSFAFGDRKALVQKGVVDACMGKIDVLGRIEYLNHYDNIAKAVLLGDFDAGIIKDTIFDEYAAKGLRKLYESDQLAGYVIAASPRMNKELREGIQKALIGITTTEQGRQALMALDKGYTGFASVEDREYDSIRKLIRRVQLKQGGKEP